MDFEDELKDGSESFIPMEKMTHIHDKLHILNYELEFLKITKLPKLNRLYFVFPTNPGEQYYNFVTLSAWLIQKCGKNMLIPQEYEDPNDVINGIITNVKEMGGIMEFSPTKLKSGCGIDVLNVLDFLSEKALLGYQYKSTMIPKDSTAVVEEHDEKEIDLTKVEEEMAPYYKDDEDDLVLMDGPEETVEIPMEQRVIESNTTQEEWRLEVERVLPQLTLPIGDDIYDWKKRQSQLEKCFEEVKDVLGQLKPPLGKLTAEVKDSVDKVDMREANLSTNLEELLKELSINEAKVKELREKQKVVTNEISGKNKELAKISDDVEASRKKLEERGNIMADGAPVAQARKDLANLKKEIQDMDTEIGVMENCILKAMLQGHISQIESQKYK